MRPVFQNVCYKRKKEKKIEVLSKASRIKKHCVHASKKETLLAGVALPPAKPKTIILVCLGNLSLCKETKGKRRCLFFSHRGRTESWRQRRRRRRPFGRMNGGMMPLTVSFSGYNIFFKAKNSSIQSKASQCCLLVDSLLLMAENQS